MKKILVLEDEANIRSFVVINLRRSGYEPIEADTGAAALEKLKVNPDICLALLDVMLPDIDGFEVCRKIRASGSKMGIIMLTAKSQEIDKVTGLMTGADDYITKPYNPTLLLLRMGNIFKRLGGSSSDIAEYGDVSIDFRRSMIIAKDGSETVLSKNEMLILSFLYNNKGQIVSRDDLMTDLWNNSEYLNDNALTVNISRLRSKLADAGMENAIETRKGQGYILL